MTILFRKNIQPRCAYCQHAGAADGATVLCARKGSVPPESHCRSFRYDPLKRIPSPHPTLQLDGTTKEDFKL